MGLDYRWLDLRPTWRRAWDLMSRDRRRAWVLGLSEATLQEWRRWTDEAEPLARVRLWTPRCPECDSRATDYTCDLDEFQVRDVEDTGERPHRCASCEHEFEATNQRAAVRYLMGRPGDVVQAAMLGGGNRSGKSEAMVNVAVALALGREHPAVVDLCAANEIAPTRIPEGPGRVAIASLTGADSRDIIRLGKLDAIAPPGSRRADWATTMRGRLYLPNGASVVCAGQGGQTAGEGPAAAEKARTAWQGDQQRAFLMDEEGFQEVWGEAERGCADHLDLSGETVAGLRMVSSTHLRGLSWPVDRFERKRRPGYRAARISGLHNPHLPKGAAASLFGSIQSPTLRRARLYGIAGIPEGAIYPHLSEETHRLARPPWGGRWTGDVVRVIDWGGNAPHVIWAAKWQGAWVVFQELAPRRGLAEAAVSEEALLDEVRAIERGERWTVTGIADSENPGGITAARRRGMHCRPASKGPGSVARGIGLVSGALAPKEGPPLLYFTEACPVTWREMVGYRWGRRVEGAEPTPAPNQADHGCDCVRYLVMDGDTGGFDWDAWADV